MSVTRRKFVTTVAGTGAAFMIVPRHVLGRGFQAPSDLVNVATVGFSGMGASNTRAVMSQNVVALCDVDLDLLDRRLNDFAGIVKKGPRQNQQEQQPPSQGAGTQGTAVEFRDFGPSKAQLAADAKWADQDAHANLVRFVEQQVPKIAKYQDYREML